MPDGAESSQLLGKVGSAECRVALTSRPWDLPIDTLVISVGAGGLGQLGHAARVRFPGEWWDGIDLDAITPDKPVASAVRDPREPIHWIILASVREPDPDQRPGSEGPVTSA